MTQAKHIMTRRNFLKMAALTTGSVGLLAACTTAPEQAATGAGGEAVAPAEEVIELTAWFTDRSTINAMTKEVLATEFQERNPTIQVKHQFVPGSEMLTKLQASYAAGQAPDMSYIDEDFMYGLIQQGVLHPIPEELIDVKAEMGRRVADFYRIPPEDKYYALPMGNMTSVLYYNQDLLDELGYTPEDIPTTWDDFVPWAKELTVWEGDELVSTGFAFNGDGIWLADAIRFQLGGWWFINDQTCAWDGQEAATAYQFVLDLFEKEKLQDKVGLPSVDQFAQGKAVTAYYWTWRQGFWISQYADLNWGTKPNPTFTGEGPYGRASEDIGFSVSTQSEDEAVINASWTLWRYLVGPDYQRRYVKFRGVQPSLIELWDEPEFSATDPQWSGIAITTEPGNFRAPGVWPGEVTNALTRSWARVRDEGTPVDEALKDACADMERVLQRQESWPLILGKEGWEANPQWLTER